MFCLSKTYDDDIEEDVMEVSSDTKKTKPKRYTLKHDVVVFGKYYPRGTVVEERFVTGTTVSVVPFVSNQDVHGFSLLLDELEPTQAS